MATHSLRATGLNDRENNTSLFLVRSVFLARWENKRAQSVKYCVEKFECKRCTFLQRSYKLTKGKLLDKLTEHFKRINEKNEDMRIIGK